VTLLSPVIEIDRFLKLIVYWAIFLVLFQLTIGFSLDRSKGQNYLTYGLPVGAGLSVLLIGLLRAKGWKERKQYLLPCFLFLFALLFSRGRASLIYPILISIVYLFISTFFGKGKRWKKIVALIIFCGLLTGFYFALTSLPIDSALLARLSATTDEDREEPRFVIWAEVWDLISRNFFGYGVDSYEKLLAGSYPHNLYLETFLSFGLVGLVILVIITVMLGLSIVKLIRLEDPSLLKLGFLSLYFLLCWNTSFDLSTSYIPLSTVVVTIAKASHYRRIPINR